MGADVQWMPTQQRARKALPQSRLGHLWLLVGVEVESRLGIGWRQKEKYWVSCPAFSAGVSSVMSSSTYDRIVCIPFCLGATVR